MVKKYIIIFLEYIYGFLCFLIYNSVSWVVNIYGIITMDEIVFYLSSAGNGVETQLFNNFINNSLIIAIIQALITLLIYKLGLYYLNCNEIIIKIRYKNKKFNYDYQTKKLKLIYKISIIIVSIFVILISFYKISFFNYLKANLITSNFIEENYVDPSKTKIVFPKDKKNLIYIYVESLESSYFDIENGGLKKENLLEPLMDITKNNINFSDSDKFGGAKQVDGTGWTTGGLVATTSGLPVKASSRLLNSYSVKTLMNNTKALGNILEENGYNQELIIGSDKRFGNRDTYFTYHGHYNIYDIGTAKNNKKIPDDYVVWWGFEDSKLFEYAKEEIIKLSEKEESFNFTILTANTHFPDGLIEKSCVKRFNNSYDNAIYCSMEQLKNFIEWVQEQDFYKNTIIVITGDHLTMQANYFTEQEYNKRSIYNLFINTNKENYNNKNRIFTSFDIFPTVISSLGAKIEGERLGLGTNLFSNEKTLPEKIGLNKFNQNISYKSIFYDNYLLK